MKLDLRDVPKLIALCGHRNKRDLIKQRIKFCKALLACGATEVGDVYQQCPHALIDHYSSIFIPAFCVLTYGSKHNVMSERTARVKN